MISKFKVTPFSFTTSRGLSARSRPLSTLLDFAAKPQDVEQLTFKKLFQPSIWICFFSLFSFSVYAAEVQILKRCDIPESTRLSFAQRLQVAQCLDWVAEPTALCAGRYLYTFFQPMPDPGMVQIDANEISFYQNQRSILQGAVEVRRQDQLLQTEKAYVDRDPKTREIAQIQFLDQLKLTSPFGVIWAKKGMLYPHSKWVKIDDALYRIESRQHGANIPAWGQAKEITREGNGPVWMKQASFTHCSPLDKAWNIRASSLMIDKEHNEGVAKHARLEILDLPVFYTPYLSFPVTKARKSGFLMPIVGSTSIGGFDLATPYYLNLAPNYDAIFIPHAYGKRGLMLGGEFRYLTGHSSGQFRGNFLPQDKAYSKFLKQHVNEVPSFANDSTNRWDVQWADGTALFIPNLFLDFNVRQLSDDYYFQDFSTNLGRITERQILRQGSVNYSTAHWLLKGTVQDYQTLHPINEIPVGDVYARLPQLLANGNYDDLPLNSRVQLTGTFDAFHWSSDLTPMPEALRYHANPIYTMELHRSWGYLTPSAQWVGNGYTLSYPTSYPNPPVVRQSQISVPRFSVDGGLYLERPVDYFHHRFTQTLEPRLYYLNVPYQNQNQVPVFDSAYMIFSQAQVFRDNRFSGFDRIGDANQLGYGLSTRWLDNDTGAEKASLGLAQLRYFADRKVTLCYTPTGVCQDDPLMLGFLSPTAAYSPLASYGVYHFNHFWSLLGDYVWDPVTRATNNGHVNFHFQTENNRIFNVGYTYLANGDLTQVNPVNPIQNNALNQISMSYAWPFNDHWSSMASYNYNLSKQYQMMTLAGLQYDSCCWGLRLVGGRTFRDLNALFISPALNTGPQYTNSVFLQVFLKGLGSVGNSDPTSVLQTYVPGYVDTFKS